MAFFEHAKYAASMIPPSNREWIIRTLRSGSSTPDQVARQFSTSDNDPIFDSLRKGFTEIKHMTKPQLDAILR
jgi:hypothetical protein